MFSVEINTKEREYEFCVARSITGKTNLVHHATKTIKCLLMLVVGTVVAHVERRNEMLQRFLCQVEHCHDETTLRGWCCC